MAKSLQKEKAFTLIELMIIAAVLAILITTIVIVQKSSVIRSKNTRILAAVAEARKMAETIYLKEGTGYTTFCNNGGGFNSLTSKELDILQKDIQDNGGSVVCWASGNSYCASIELFGDKGFFCIDDEGHFGPTNNQICTDENAVCP